MIQNIITFIAHLGNTEATFFSAHPWLIIIGIVAIIAAIVIGLWRPKRKMQ